MKIRALTYIDERLSETLFSLIEETQNKEIMDTLHSSEALSKKDIEEMIVLLKLQLEQPEFYLVQLPKAFLTKNDLREKPNSVYYKPDKTQRAKFIYTMESKSYYDLKEPYRSVKDCFDKDSLELDMLRASHGHRPNRFQRAKTIHQKNQILGLKFCSPWLTNYRPYVLQEVKKDGFNAVYMHPRFTEDVEIMKFAVLSKPWILRIFPQSMWQHLRLNEDFLLENKELFPLLYERFLDNKDLIEAILFEHPNYILYTRNSSFHHDYLLYAFLRNMHIDALLTKEETVFLQQESLVWLKKQPKEVVSKLKRLNQETIYCEDESSDSHLLLLRMYAYFHKKIAPDELNYIEDLKHSVENTLILDWKSRQTIEWFTHILVHKSSETIHHILKIITLPPKNILSTLLENNMAIPNEIKLTLFGFID